MNESYISSQWPPNPIIATQSFEERAQLDHDILLTAARSDTRFGIWMLTARAHTDAVNQAYADTTGFTLSSSLAEAVQSGCSIHMCILDALESQALPASVQEVLQAVQGAQGSPRVAIGCSGEAAVTREFADCLIAENNAGGYVARITSLQDDSETSLVMNHDSNMYGVVDRLQRNIEQLIGVYSS